MHQLIPALEDTSSCSTTGPVPAADGDASRSGIEQKKKKKRAVSGFPFPLTALYSFTAIRPAGDQTGGENREEHRIVFAEVATVPQSFPSAQLPPMVRVRTILVATPMTIRLHQYGTMMVQPAFLRAIHVKPRSRTIRAFRSRDKRLQTGPLRRAQVFGIRGELESRPRLRAPSCTVPGMPVRAFWCEIRAPRRRYVKVR